MNSISPSPINRQDANIVCVIGKSHTHSPRAFIRLTQITFQPPQSAGGPGVGKGTQCTRLAEDLGLAHISVGDLLREEAARPSDGQGVDIKDIMSKASLVPHTQVQSVLTRCLNGFLTSGQCNFLIDGFPRSMQQARLFADEGSDPFFSATKSAQYVHRLIIAAGLDHESRSAFLLLRGRHALPDFSQSSNLGQSR